MFALLLVENMEPDLSLIYRESGPRFTGIAEILLSKDYCIKGKIHHQENGAGFACV